MKRLMKCVFAGTLVALSSCASTMQVTASWQRPNYEAPGFKKIAVVAWIGEKDTRRAIENYVVSELAKLGIAGVAVNDVFAELPTPQQADVIRERLRGMGADGAITVRLMDRSFREKTVAPVAASDRYARDFYGGYMLFYDLVYVNTTVDVETRYVVECTLYGLDGRGPVAIREITLKKTHLVEELRDGSSLLVTSLNESGALTGRK